jgi:hypothetical protein
MKKISMLLAFVAFFATVSFAKKPVVKPLGAKVEITVEKQKNKVSELKATNESITIFNVDDQKQRFPLSIQASCGTFTFQYTCDGCNWSQILSDIQILTAWSELTCMIFF